MNQVDTSPLPDRGTAGWTFVGLAVVDELVRFRILQLLHTPCISCCMSPLHPCSHLWSSGPCVPSPFNTSLHDLSFRLLSPLVALLEWSSFAISSYATIMFSSHPMLVNDPDKEDLCCTAFSGAF